MDFGKALEALKAGKKVKLPSWKGYWQKDGDTIKMHCKDGRVLDLRETEDVFYTLSNIVSDEWEIAEECDINLSVKTFNFGEAIRNLKGGKKVARRGWNGKGIYLELQRPDKYSKMTLPYIYIVTSGLMTNNPDAPKGVVPWLASQTDILAEDWEVV